MQTGKQDQLKTIDAYLWATCMIESEPAPPLCPIPFKNAVCQLLSENLGMSIDDVTHENCHNVYLRLVRHMSVLVADGVFRLPLTVM